MYNVKWNELGSSQTLNLENKIALYPLKGIMFGMRSWIYELSYSSTGGSWACRKAQNDNLCISHLKTYYLELIKSVRDSSGNPFVFVGHWACRSGNKQKIGTDSPTERYNLLSYLSRFYERGNAIKKAQLMLSFLYIFLRRKYSFYEIKDDQIEYDWN